MVVVQDKDGKEKLMTHPAAIAIYAVASGIDQQIRSQTKVRTTIGIALPAIRRIFQ